ncbi:MAG: prephenate dehydrogenase [Rikenellaceae bacterium]
MNIAIVGVGLMGGSFALSLKDNSIAKKIIGVDSNSENSSRALELGIVDEVVAFEDIASREDIDLIVITIPVNAIPTVAIKLLNKVRSNQIIMDMGSTKSELCEMISEHRNRNRFVATHPMWGTEKHGPEAAVHGAFSGRVTVICEESVTDKDAVEAVEQIYTKIGMRVTYMDAEQHDLHAAYVSHISHITSYALALTVLEKERSEDKILDLSGAGFETTVRLAKSSPSMWTPIFMQNKYNVLDVLREHIHQLQVIRKMIEKDDFEGLNNCIVKANTIEKILSRKKQ